MYIYISLSIYIYIYIEREISNCTIFMSCHLISRLGALVLSLVLGVLCIRSSIIRVIINIITISIVLIIPY